MNANTACLSFIPLLSSFVDGELSSSQRRSVEHHLQGCKDCTARAADLRAQSGLVRIGLEVAADEADFSQFASQVISRITPDRLPLFSRWKLSISELFTYHRAAMISSLVTAGVAVAIAIPIALRSAPPAGYASERMAVQRVTTVPEAHVAPVVMKGEHGNAIIWLVNHQHVLAEPEEGVADGGSKPNRPRGGEL